MLYQRSMSIERRLMAVLSLIQTGKYSTPMLAEELDISIPTVSRLVSALRERGHDIQSRRKDGAWYFMLIRKPNSSLPAREIDNETARENLQEVDPRKARTA
jgi:biotin operon repressor